jgi:hypothetical protein
MIATAEDISGAIDTIPSHEFVRLKDFAENRITRIGSAAANGRTGDDLLQEAVTRLLEGTRHWDSAKVDIARCVIGVMRSIASAWAGHRQRNRFLPEYASTESELMTFGLEGRPTSPFDGFKADEMTVEEQALAKDGEAERKAFADEIEAACAGDHPALKVLAAFQCGIEGPTIQRDFCWTETEYRTTVRRIKRRAHKLAAKRYARQSQNHN